MEANFYNENGELIYTTNDIYIHGVNKEFINIIISDKSFKDSEKVELFLDGSYLSDKISFELPEYILEQKIKKYYPPYLYIKYDN